MQPWQEEDRGFGGEWPLLLLLLLCRRRHGQDAEGQAHGAGEDAAQEQARRQEDRQKERGCTSTQQWGTMCIQSGASSCEKGFVEYY